MHERPILAALAAALLLGACAMPDPHSGPGHGAMGMPGGQHGGPSGPMGPHFGHGGTPGWEMMSPQEREEHHQRMMSARNAQECRQRMDEHRMRMQERARERGLSQSEGSGDDACAAWRD